MGVGGSAPRYPCTALTTCRGLCFAHPTLNRVFVFDSYAKIMKNLDIIRQRLTNALRATGAGGRLGQAQPSPTACRHHEGSGLPTMAPLSAHPPLPLLCPPLNQATLRFCPRRRACPWWPSA